MHQKNLFQPEQLLDELELDLRRTEPVLWIRHLVILKRPSPVALVREIPFHLGLNVIRTERRRDDESEVVAHSVGKTLLMRLLRYTLGEPAFATGADTKRIRKKLPEGVVAAEWVVAGQMWTVVRPLGEADADASYVVRGIEWKEVFQASATREPISVFLTRIEDAMFGDLPKLQHMKGGPPGWLDVLAWIGRDSDCGFRKPTCWRDKDLNPPGLRDPHVNKLVMQWLMGLMSDGEASVRERSAETSELKKTLKKEVAQSEHSLRQTYDSLAERSGFESPRFDEMTEELTLPHLVEELSAFVADNKREAEERLEGRSHDANEQIRTLELRERQQNEQRNAAAIDASTARTTRDLRKRQFRDETKKATGPEQCPAKEECAWLIQMRKEEQAGAGASKSLILEELQQEIEDAESKTTEAEGREQRLAKQAEATRVELESARNDFAKESSKLERTVGRLQGLSEQAAYLSKAADAFAIAVERQNTAEGEFKEVGKEIDVEQADIKVRTSVRQLTHCYLHVLKRVFQPEAEGEVKIDRNGLLPHPSAELTPNGTAMAVMARVLSFELACVIASACGLGAHPRLLMHDSPREGEMEPPLFRRLFEVLLWMEQKFSETSCAFQYIITSADPPKQFDAVEERVVDILHGRSDEGRLLRVRY